MVCVYTCVRRAVLCFTDTPRERSLVSRSTVDDHTRGIFCAVCCFLSNRPQIILTVVSAQCTVTRFVNNGLLIETIVVKEKLFVYKCVCVFKLLSVIIIIIV